MPCSRIFCFSFASFSGSTADFARGFGGGTFGNPRNSFGVPGGGSSDDDTGIAATGQFASAGRASTFATGAFGTVPNPRTGSCRGTAVARPAPTFAGNNHTPNGK